MATMMGLGESYKVQYLGCNMLSMTALTGLGSLQRPLREMYFRYRQDAAKTKIRLQQRQLVMSDQGMLVSYEGDSKTPSQREFYTIPDILSWHAVQFVTVKCADKKADKMFKAAFEPLDNDHSRNKDNLFATLDKPFHFLSQQRHPPLFCCVLRRTQGVKALDIHAFVCSSDSEALGLVRALNAVSSSYATDEQQETGVFGYNPFGKENVRSAAGIERAVHGGSRTQPEIQHQFILRHPGDSSLDRGQPATRSASVKEKQNPAKTPLRPVSSLDISSITGSQPNLSISKAGSGPRPKPGGQRDRDSRVFLLSQEDFLSGGSTRSIAECDEEDPVEAALAITRREQSAKKLADPPPQTYEYLQHIDKTLERPRNTPHQERNKSSQAVPAHYASGSNSRTNGDSDRKQVQQSFSSGGIFQEDNNFVASDPGKRNKHSPNGERSMGQGYSLLSSSSGPLPGYAPPQNSRRPYNPSPTEQQQGARSPYGSSDYQRIPSPQYQGTTPRNTSDTEASTMGRNSHAEYQNINDFNGGSLNRQDLVKRPIPGAYPIPVLPTRSPLPGNNELLQRGINRSPERRQTTQGMVKAQVTPQSQRSSSPFGSRRGLPNRDGTGDAYRRDSDPPGSARSTQPKPVAKVPPHKVQGVKVLPTQPNQSVRDSSGNIGNIHERRDVRAFSQSQPSDILRNRPSSMFLDSAGSGRKLKPTNQYFPDQKTPSTADSPIKDIYALPNKKNLQKTRSKEQSKPIGATNWQFQKTPPKDSSYKSAKSPPGSAKDKIGVQGQSQSQVQDQGKSQGGGLIQTEKKDAEIASLLQNIHFDYEGTISTHAPHRTNFEKSLGYFP